MEIKSVAATCWGKTSDCGKMARKMEIKSITSNLWRKAPPWAKFLAQDLDGSWFFFESMPVPNSGEGFWTPNPDADKGYRCERAVRGKCPSSWLDTLSSRVAARD